MTYILGIDETFHLYAYNSSECESDDNEEREERKKKKFAKKKLINWNEDGLH